MISFNKKEAIRDFLVNKNLTAMHQVDKVSSGNRRTETFYGKVIGHGLPVTVHNKKLSSILNLC